ncbi:CPBP family intramembrane metalloprotease [Candidatus Thorarchaeota archaeon]|nr:MAG: CPBP family intramembrane metalloprotease [Candidatus Thorarchaeota archaeon]
MLEPDHFAAHIRIEARDMVTTQIQEKTELEYKDTSSWTTAGLIKIAGIMLGISAIWRIVDQFVLGLGSTWMNIFPSKLFPLLIILGFFLKYRPQEIGSVLGLSQDKIKSRVAIGILIGIIFSIGIDIGGTLVYGVFIDPTYPLQLHILNEDLLGYMFIFFLTNAFLEEALFRGLLLNAAKTHLSSTASILLSAIIFGLWHASWPLVNGAMGGEALSGVASIVFFTMILGIFFGIYYERFSSSKSLLGPIAVHTIVNFVNECFKVGPEPVIQGPDVVFANSGLMMVTLLLFFLTFIPLSIILWKTKLEQTTNFWLRLTGKEYKEEQQDHEV